MVEFHVVLGSYVDDAFGGAQIRDQASLMMNTLTHIGRATATFFNLDKAEGPARELVILGLCYSSSQRSCRIGAKKRTKYLARITHVLSAPTVTSAELAQLAGNLSFAA